MHLVETPASPGQGENGIEKHGEWSGDRVNGSLGELDVLKKKKEVVDSNRKPLKRSRTTFSRPRKRRRNTPEVVPDTVVIGVDLYEDPNSKFCYCQKPFTDSAFCIQVDSMFLKALMADQCDNCDEWFHGSCADVKEEDSTGKRSVWKQTCEAVLYSLRDKELQKSDEVFSVLPTCKKYIDSAHNLDPEQPREEGVRKSRYCSLECGRSLGRHRLQLALRCGKLSRRKKHHAPEVESQVPKASLPDLSLDAYRHDEQQDILLLEDCKKRRRIHLDKIKVLETRIAFIDLTIETANSFVDKEDGSRLCGFDSRIVSEYPFPEGFTPPDKSADTKSGEEPSSEGNEKQPLVYPETLCRSKGKCVHDEWQDLKSTEVDLEIQNELDVINTILQEEELILERINRRRGILGELFV
ncbi:hypothetical protein HDU97_007032 [Phlyctochytrium planicorne]|nr:hypothetical protein HDU97_007032 [Phlyctochytrium planicorne]